MKQLLLVNSVPALNGGAAKPTDLLGMAKGAFGAYEIKNPGVWLTAAPSSNYALVLGGGPRVNALVIPEVNIDNVNVVVTNPVDGNVASVDFTVPAIVPGNTYTAIIVKKGVEFNERNKYTADIYVPKNSTKTANDVAAAIGAQFTAMANSGSIDITVTVAAAKVTVQGISKNDNFDIVLTDALSGVAKNVTTANKAIGDKEYVTNLVQECISDRGIDSLYGEGKELYPGYPVPVEDDKYTIITLRYKNYRKAGLTSGDATPMTTHIAVPSKSPALATIKAIFGVVAGEG